MLTKPRLIFAGFILLVTVLSILVFSFKPYAPVESNKFIQAKIGSHNLNLETANNNKSREIGLSGRAELPSDNGMLFVYESPNTQCIWMKDMMFDIDILWLNAQRQVVHIKSNVRPDTYPESFCIDDSLYVLELNAGKAYELGLLKDQELVF